MTHARKKFMSVLALIIALFYVAVPTAIAQNQAETTRAITSNSVRGQVVDENDEPLPGATVVLVGTKKITTTDADGRFAISLGTSDGKAQSITITYVGMQRKTLKVTPGKSVRIELMTDPNQLAEIEVVEDGFNRLPRKDMVGAFTTVKAEDIMMPAFTSIDQMLQGKVAGMVVANTSSRVGSNPTIKIRGTSTILGNSDPLWVVDGVIQTDPISLNASDLQTQDLGTLLGNQISWLNPQDIETITVLKDASATALYGSKASNGVIVVTTKRGTEGRTSVRYSNNFSIRTKPNYGMFNYMNSLERIQFSKEAYDAGARYQSDPLPQKYTYEGLMAMFNKRMISESEFERQMQYLETVNTDWLDILTRNSFSQNHNLSVSGGNSKYTFNASFGYSSNHGTEIGNDENRLTSRLNIGANLSSRLRVDFNINGSFTNSDGYAGGVSPQSYALSTSRAVPLYEENGDLAFYKQYYSYKYNARDINTLEYGYNILNEMDNTYSKNKSTTFNISANIDFKIIEGLNYQFLGSLASSGNDTEAFVGENSSYVERNYRGYPVGAEKAGSEKFKAAMMPYGGQLKTAARNTDTYSMQHKLVFSKTFNEIHRLNVLAGFEMRTAKSESNSNTVWGYMPDRGQSLKSPTYPAELEPIGMDTPIRWGALNDLYTGAWSKRTNKNNQVSYYGMVAYSLTNRYVFNANFRSDASNRFGQDANHQFNPTYSFGVQWRMAQESFIKDHIYWLNQLNLRATYGVQGNVVNSVSPNLIAQYSQATLPGYEDEFILSISSLPNPLLTWESTRTWNFGLDMQIFNGVSMNFEYYGRRSNAIMQQDALEEYGMSTVKLNGGRIYNHGVEFSMNLTPFRSRDFAWTISLNMSKNWNKTSNEDRLSRTQEVTKSEYINGNSSRPLKRGYPLNAFWSYSFAGLDPETGYPTFNYIENDGTGDTTVDPTTFLVYSGETQPYFTGGFNTRLRYKDFVFGANFSALVGAKKRLPDPYASFSNGKLPSPFSNLSKDLLNRWQKPGDEQHTIIPALYTSVDPVYNVITPDGLPTSIYQMWAQSDAMVASGSFLRCTQLSLSYQLPKEICKKFYATSPSVSGNINNLFVIASSRWNGFDPELGSSVHPKIYSLGLSVGF